MKKKGMLSPRLVMLISDIRLRGGEVRLWKCGRFVMPSNLTEVTFPSFLFFNGKSYKALIHLIFG